MSQVGRFTALDPIDSPGASPYAYCMNNPLRLVDPTGCRSLPRPGGGGGGQSGPGGWRATHPRDHIPWDEDYWSRDWFGQNASRLYRPPELSELPAGSHASPWGSGNHYADLFLARSAVMDPAFWFPGWDYYCGSEFKQALFLLSSGIFEWDVFTWDGWQHINIGEWLRANNVKIVNALMDLQYLGLTGYGTMYGHALGDDVMLIDLESITTLGGGIYGLAGSILHEATHLLQRSLGISTVAYTLAAALEMAGVMERQAYSVEGYYFGALYNDSLRKNWIKGAASWGLVQP